MPKITKIKNIIRRNLFGFSIFWFTHFPIAIPKSIGGNAQSRQ